MDKPKRPKLHAQWDDVPREWGANNMEDLILVKRYADDMDQWLTEEVLPVLREIDHHPIEAWMNAALTDDSRACDEAKRNYAAWFAAVEKVDRLIAQIEEA